MRGLVFCVAFLCCAGAVRAAEEGAPAAHDFRVVERIEEACRVGVRKARTEDEALACLRWRNGALAAIVEVAYEATVAWLADREYLARVLEEEQGVWLAAFRAMPGDTREELEERAVFLRRRLGAFMRVTRGE